MPTEEIVFSQRLLKLKRDDFKKYYPISALKGMKVRKSSSLTHKKHFEITIPENKHFPHGVWWTTVANDAYDAKRKTIGHLIDSKTSKEC